jgi:amino acid transporter
MNEGHPAALRKTLSYWDLVAYGLAYIAPIAPLSTIGFVWDASGGLVVLAYLLGAVCMYFTARSYATMCEAVPHAGSVYAFARLGLGRFAGFMAGWMILLDYLLIPALLYVLASIAMGTLLPQVGRWVWIVLTMGITLVVNWFGIRVTTRVNFAFLALQALMLLAFLALALVALLGGKGDGALTLRPVFDAASFDAGKIFSATSICVLSFLGFDAISTLAEETKDSSGKTVGRAIMGTLVVATLIFVVQTWIVGDLLPGLRIQDPAAAAFELAHWAVGAGFAAFMAWVIALVNGFSNPVPMQAGVARVLFAMGRDRQLPSALGRVHPKYGTPYVSMLASSALSLVIALAMRDNVDELASIVNFGALTGFALLHLSVLNHFAVKMRSRRIFVHWTVPLVGLGVVLAVLSGMSRFALDVGMTWMAAGAVYGFVLRARNRDEIRAVI